MRKHTRPADSESLEQPKFTGRLRRGFRRRQRLPASITSDEFSANDFRTWAGTVLASRELIATGLQRNRRDCKHMIVGAIKSVARSLGNRAAT